MGSALGGELGNLAAQALPAPAAPPPRPPPAARAGPRRPRPPGLRTAGAGGAPVAPHRSRRCGILRRCPGPTAPAPASSVAGGSAAAAQGLVLTQQPEVLRSLLATALGQQGRQQVSGIPVGQILRMFGQVIGAGGGRCR